MKKLDLTREQRAFLRDEIDYYKEQTSRRQAMYTPEYVYRIEALDSAIEYRKAKSQRVSLRMNSNTASSLLPPDKIGVYHLGGWYKGLTIIIDGGVPDGDVMIGGFYHHIWMRTPTDHSPA